MSPETHVDEVETQEEAPRVVKPRSRLRIAASRLWAKLSRGGSDFSAGPSDFATRFSESVLAKVGGKVGASGIVCLVVFVMVAKFLGTSEIGLLGWLVVLASAPVGAALGIRRGIAGVLLYWVLLSLGTLLLGGQFLANPLNWRDILYDWNAGYTFEWADFFYLSGFILLQPVGALAAYRVGVGLVAAVQAMRALWLELFAPEYEIAKVSIREEDIEAIEPKIFASFDEFRAGEEARAEKRQAAGALAGGEDSATTEGETGGVRGQGELQFEGDVGGPGAEDYVPSIVTAGPKESGDEARVATEGSNRLAEIFGSDLVSSGAEMVSNGGDLGAAEKFVRDFMTERASTGVPMSNLVLAWRDRFTGLSDEVRVLVGQVNGGAEILAAFGVEVSSDVGSTGNQEDSVEVYPDGYGDGGYGPYDEPVTVYENTAEDGESGKVDEVIGPLSSEFGGPRRMVASDEVHDHEYDGGEDVFGVDDGHVLEPDEDDVIEIGVVEEVPLEDEGAPLEAGVRPGEGEDAVGASVRGSENTVEDDEPLDEGSIELILMGIVASISEMDLDENGVARCRQLAGRMKNFRKVFEALIDGKIILDAGDDKVSRLKDFVKGVLFEEDRELIEETLQSGDVERLRQWSQRLAVWSAYRPAKEMRAGIELKIEALEEQAERVKEMSRNAAVPPIEGKKVSVELEGRSLGGNITFAAEALRKDILSRGLEKATVRLVAALQRHMVEYVATRERIMVEAVEGGFQVEDHRDHRYLDERLVNVYHAGVQVKAKERDGGADVTEYVRLTLGEAAFVEYGEVLKKTSTVEDIEDRLSGAADSGEDGGSVEYLLREYGGKVEELSAELKRSEIEKTGLSEEIAELRKKLEGLGLEAQDEVQEVEKMTVGSVIEAVCGKFGRKAKKKVKARLGKSFECDFDLSVDLGEELLLAVGFEGVGKKLKYDAEKDELTLDGRLLAEMMVQGWCRAAEAFALGKGFDEWRLIVVVECEKSFMAIANKGVKKQQDRLQLMDTAAFEKFIEIDIEGRG